MQRSLRIVDWKDFDHMVRKIADWAKDFDYIYGELRGGLVPAVALSHLTGIPMTNRTDLPSTLWIDDIIDSGETVGNAYDFAGRAALYKRRGVDADAFYCKEFVDHWVVFPWEDINKAKADRDAYEARHAAR